MAISKVSIQIFEEGKYKYMIIVMCAIIGVLLVIFGSTFIFLHCKFSGSPCKSELFKKKHLHIGVVNLIWSLAFMIKIVLMIVMIHIYENLQNDQDPSQQDEDMNTEVILQFVYSIFTEIVPYFLTLDLNFIKLLQTDYTQDKPQLFTLDRYSFFNASGIEESVQLPEAQANANLNKLQVGDDMERGMQSRLLSSDLMNLAQAKEGRRTNDNRKSGSIARFSLLKVLDDNIESRIGNKKIVKFEQGQLELELLVDRKDFSNLVPFVKPWYNQRANLHRFGKLHTCTFNGQTDYMCRVVEFQRITSYQMEGYFHTLTKLILIQMKNFIIPVSGYFIKETSFYIFFPQKVSLYEILYDPEKQEIKKLLTPEIKLQISMELAKILYSFHSVTPPICHGHLSSHNIFVDLITFSSKVLPNNQSVRIVTVQLGDIESLSLLKYANSFQDYRMCNVWASPEAMKTPKKIPDITQKMDIYSYGILLWELWHEILPFDGDLDMAIKYVLHDDSRPMINIGNGPQECNEQTAQIIRKCWQSNPESRPSFQAICELLETVLI